MISVAASILAFASIGAATAVQGEKSPSKFRVAESRGTWTFVDPDEKSMWSLGVCCTGIGVAPEKIDPKNPHYSGLQHYKDERAWVLGTQRNLRSWGFNTLGGWSEMALFDKYGGAEKMPYFTVLHLGAYDKVPWNDVFAPQFAEKIDGAAKDQILKLRDDPKLVGYFTDNEIGWWGDAVFVNYFGMSASSPGKQKLVEVFREHYGNDFAEFRREWKTTATDFDGLLATPAIHLKPGTDGIQVVRKWMTRIADHYYRSVRDAVRRYDKEHLILGDRYCQFYDPEVVRASKPYIDVASTNLGAEWTDGTTSRFFLDTIHRLTGKPIVISEFYMTAMENRSGNKNSSGGFPVVKSQKERAASFRRYVEGLARTPYVVGAHWFQFWDEPPKGRGDGEDYNMGLVDIYGKPYEGMVAASRSLSIPALRKKGPTVVPKGRTPRSVAAPLDGLKSWPRDRAFIPAAAAGGIADLYATWTDGAIDVGLYAMEYADERLWEGGKMPEEDRSLLTIEVGGKTVQVRYGGKDRRATSSDPAVKVRDFPGVKPTLIVRIPVPGLRAGKSLPLRASFATHGRGHRSEWRTTLRP